MYSNDKLSFQFVLSSFCQTNGRLNTRDYNQNFSKTNPTKKNSKDPQIFSQLYCPKPTKVSSVVQQKLVNCTLSFISISLAQFHKKRIQAYTLN